LPAGGSAYCNSIGVSHNSHGANLPRCLNARDVRVRVCIGYANLTGGLNAHCDSKCGAYGGHGAHLPGSRDARSGDDFFPDGIGYANGPCSSDACGDSNRVACCCGLPDVTRRGDTCGDGDRCACDGNNAYFACGFNARGDSDGGAINGNSAYGTCSSDARNNRKCVWHKGRGCSNFAGGSYACGGDSDIRDNNRGRANFACGRYTRDRYDNADPTGSLKQPPEGAVVRGVIACIPCHI
jgi:hypothetical protein